jgi:PAS domain S-box-containing protein
VPGPDYAENWLTWWLGDIGGVIVVAPLLLAWGEEPGVAWEPRRLAEGLSLLATILLVSQAIFGGWLPAGFGYSLPYLTIPFLGWAALRFGPRETATVFAAMAAIAIWGTARGVGPFRGQPLNHSLLLLQSYLTIVGVTSLALAAAIAERRRIEERLREGEQRFHVMADTAPVLIWMSGPDAGCTFFNKPWLDFTGRSMEQELGDGWTQGVHPDDLDRCLGTYRTAFDARLPFRMEYRLRRADGVYRWILDTGISRFTPEGTFAGYIGSAIDIEEQKRAEEALAVRRRQLETVKTISEEITRELELGTLLNLITRRAMELVRAEGGVVYLWDEASRALIPKAWHGFGEWMGEFRLRLGQGVAGAVADRREGLIVNDYRSSPYAIPLLLERTMFTAVVAEPLLYRDRLVGAFSLTARQHFTESGRDLLTLFATQAATAIENARLYTEARTRTDQVTALLEMNRAVGSTLDLEDILQVIVREAAKLSANTSVHLFLLAEGPQVLLCRAGIGLPPELYQDLVVPLGESFSGQVAATGQPVAVADVRGDPRVRFPKFVTEHGLISYLGLPVKVGERVIGVLVFNTNAPRTYSEAEIAYLSAFATQAAVAIENARLFAATERAAREARSLYEVAHSLTTSLDLSEVLRLIALKMRELLGTSHAQVVLYDEATQQLRLGAAFGAQAQKVRAQQFRLGHGVNGIVAQTRAPLIVNDYQAFPHRVPELPELVAVIGVPLLYRDRLLGVLTSHSTQPGFAFTPDHLALLTSFANQAAIAIETANLHRAAVRRGEEMEALLRATRSVMGELNLQKILEQIVAEATQISACSHVKVLVLDKNTGVLRLGAIQGGRVLPDFQLPLGVGLSGIVAQTGEPLFVGDAGNDPRNVLQAEDRELGVATYLGLPIKIRDEVLGVLTFNTSEPRRYNTEELAYLTSFADQAAIAIQNAHLFAELNQSYRDLQAAQGELVRAEKLRALGQMAAGIAHDLNNMLAAILGQAELLTLQVADPGARERLRLLETAARDGAHLVRRLQDFSRQRPSGVLLPCQIAPLVHEALEITRPRWKDEPQRRGRVIEVYTAVEGAPPILGHPADVREALVNLILNAADAMPDGGTLTLRVWAEEQRSGGAEERGGELIASLRPCVPAPPHVVLEVSDTGVGMSEEVKARIFEPFFTTKGVQGTGLGLSMVYGIMERHGGHISVASAPGQGTTVTCRFRVAPATVAEERPAAPAPLPPRRILLIDDDPMVRQTITSLLRAAGHTVEEADGGAAGITRLIQAEFDVVITDLGMPGVTGWDVSRAVKSLKTPVPVILLTGWGEHSAAEEPDRGLVNRVLGKPFRMEDILEAIAELTEARP